MTRQNKSVINLIAQNMFRHPNFWNIRNFKNRVHVILLALVPIYCKDETLRNRYNQAKYNFWSACGDKGDYDYLMHVRKKLKKCESR